MPDDQNDDRIETPSVRAVPGTGHPRYWLYQIRPVGCDEWGCKLRNLATVDRLVQLGLGKKQANAKLNNARKRFRRVIDERGTLRPAATGEDHRERQQPQTKEIHDGHNGRDDGRRDGRDARRATQGLQAEGR